MIISSGGPTSSASAQITVLLYGESSCIILTTWNVFCSQWLHRNAKIVCIIDMQSVHWKRWWCVCMNSRFPLHPNTTFIYPHSSRSERSHKSEHRTLAYHVLLYFQPAYFLLWKLFDPNICHNILYTNKCPKYSQTKRARAKNIRNLTYLVICEISHMSM